MAKIKICGLRRDEDITSVNILKPDYAGFILTNGFRRSIDMDTVRRLRDRMSGDIKAVGVFVNENVQIVNACVKMGIIDIVQLHGCESPEYCAEINATVIKAFKPTDFDKIKEYNDVCDYFLFDSGTGTGRAFDWNSVPETEKPFFLAGGIDVGNIDTAIKQMKPYCIDVSSSVETDGFKDYNKIKEIITKCREVRI